jgi:hypothetical protein
MVRLLKMFGPLARSGHFLVCFFSQGPSRVQTAEDRAPFPRSRPKAEGKHFLHYFNEALSGGGRR